MSMTHTLADDTMMLDTDGYVESGAESCPYPGTYMIKPLSVGRAKDKDGNDRLQDGWPILKINRVQITNEDGTTDKFAVFQDVRTKPSQRKGPGNRPVWASQAADVLRAINIDTFKEQSNFEEVYQALEQELAAGNEFAAYVGLTARDNAYLKANLKEDMSQEDRYAVYAKATLNTKDFKNPDGTFRFTAEGPSGATLTAKPTLSRYVAADKRDTVEFGPQK